MNFELLLQLEGQAKNQLGPQTFERGLKHVLHCTNLKFEILPTTKNKTIKGLQTSTKWEVHHKLLSKSQMLIFQNKIAN